MDDAARIETAKRYLRRTYYNNVNGLKELAERIWNQHGAVDAVTITGQTFEGGQAQGQLTFEPLAYLAAVEELIAELDPDNTPPERPNVTVAQFGPRSTSIPL